MISPDVELCGYSIPHPSETKMNIRIQTYGSSRHLFRLPRILGSSCQRQCEADFLFRLSLKQLGRQSTMRWRRVLTI